MCRSSATDWDGKWLLKSSHDPKHCPGGLMSETTMLNVQQIQPRVCYGIRVSIDDAIRRCWHMSCKLAVSSEWKNTNITNFKAFDELIILTYMNHINK